METYFPDHAYVNPNKLECTHEHLEHSKQSPLAEVSASMASGTYAFDHADYVAQKLCSLRRSDDFKSETEVLDQSRPPTPDGTGRPNNFQQVAPGLYRSSFPKFEHFEALSELELKTIITLVPEELDLEYAKFITTNGITHYVIPILANKDPERYTDDATVTQVLELMLDARNYPMLIHCNKGKHRTGCMTACFRKACGWSDDAVIEEYVKYSTPKNRPLDEVFIRRFDATEMKALALERNYVGGPYAQTLDGTSTYSERSWTTVMSGNSAATAAGQDESTDYQATAKREHVEMMKPYHTWMYK